MTDETTASAAGLLRRAVVRHRGRFAASTALFSLHQVCEALVPVAIGLIIDRAVAPGDSTAMAIGLAGLVLLFVVLTNAWRFGFVVGSVAVERENHQLRTEVTEHLLGPRPRRTGLRSGELLTLATSDTQRATEVLRTLALTVAGLAAVVLCAVLLLRVDVVLGVGVLVGVPLVLLGVQAFSPVVARRTSALQEWQGRATAVATDLVAGGRVLRGIGAEGHAGDRYTDASRRTLSATLAAAGWRGAAVGVATALGGLLLAAVAGGAGWLALDGQISIGEFITVIGLAQFLAEPVTLVGRTLTAAADSWASAGRLARLLSAPELWRDGSLPAPQRGRLALRGVAHGGLGPIDLDAPAGSLVGVVTTRPVDAADLMTVLSREGDPADVAGAVLVDDVDVTDLLTDASRRALLVEPHRVDLFEDTVRTNLVLADPSRSAAPDVLVAAGADDVVAAHPDGLERRLRDRGSGLSGGQRQRLGLARALLADPAVLVLQDPTSAVDAVTEAQVADGLAQVRHGAGSRRTTLVLTSSPALLDRCDEVVLVEDGRVSDRGPHRELLGRVPHYRDVVAR